ncbi:hypothetical protein [Streptomyces sp. NPDC057889]|uniref:hypothetical protein n=1 Tax=unclassified Streptomyces TaxID=2593676 RepID=UPI0036C26CAD
MPKYTETVTVVIPDNAIGVDAKANGTALSGVSQKWHGVYGETNSVIGGIAVKGVSLGTAVVGESKTWYGVYGASKGNGNAGAAGVYALGDYTYGNPASAIALYAKTVQNFSSWAGVFEGRVRLLDFVEAPGAMQVYPNSNNPLSATFFKPIKVLGGVRGSGAYAEIFEAPVKALPGAVLIVEDDGLLAPCREECDTRVVGVVSAYQDGDTPETSEENEEESAEEESSHQVPIAMAGTVSVLADAQYGEISPGDLLTTSPTSGCAMLVKDRARASGAIIGKALSSLDKETGVIRMLVMVT